MGCEDSQGFLRESNRTSYTIVVSDAQEELFTASFAIKRK